MSAKFIFADTNLFLRYLTNDIPEQAGAFEGLLRRAASGDLTLVTNSLVLAEIVWTLESFYRLSKEDVRSRVMAILNTPGLEVADGDILLQATHWYAEKNVDFIDAYNAAWMFNREIDTACTFDRKHFSRFENINIVVPGMETDQTRS
jgi:predicted nucleic-acid-binding protein